MKLNRTSTRLLQITMLVLCLVCTVTLFYELNRDYSLFGYPYINGKTVNTSVADYTAKADITPLGHYNIILDRPLFSEDRRAHIYGAGTVSKSAMGNPDVNSGNLDDYLLTAVIITENNRMALLKPKSGKPLKVGVGETIFGWTLTNVEPHEISLNRGSETRTLELQIIKSPNQGIHALSKERQASDRKLSEDGSIEPIHVNESNVPGPIPASPGDVSRN